MTPIAWTPLDVSLIGLAGVLLGLVLSGRGKDPKNRPIARLLGLVLEPIYWWLDLWSPGIEPPQPSHRKVMYAATMGVMLGNVVLTSARDVAPDGTLSFNTWLLGVAVMAFALGPHAYNALLHKVLGKDGVRDSVATRVHQAAGRPSAPGLAAPDT
jgi:hypothetical protein